VRREVLISGTPFGVRTALGLPGAGFALRVESALRPSLVGDLFLGRVRRVIPALRGAFVALEGAREGWLESGERLDPGQALIVQVLSDARGRKQPRLGAAPALAGARLVLRPHGRAPAPALSAGLGEGPERDRLAALARTLDAGGGAFTLRRAAAGASAESLTAEAAFLRAQWLALEAEAGRGEAPRRLHGAGGLLGRLVREETPAGTRFVVDDPATAQALERLAAPLAAFAPLDLEQADDADLFERHDIAAAFQAGLEAERPFAGGRLTIEETEALTALDVDLAVAAALPALRRAVEAAAAAILERNLAGLIVLDLPRPGGRKQDAGLAQAFAAALAADRAAHRVHGFSAAGLLELTRQRIGESLGEALTERAAPGGARLPRADALAFDLAAAARAAVRRGARRLTLRAAPRLAALLEPGPTLPGGLGAWLRAAVRVEAEPGRPLHDFAIEAPPRGGPG
jgi:Rne/Rng family ribonuclease